MQTIGLGSIHVHPAIIPFWAARAKSIPAVTPLRRTEETAAAAPRRPPAEPRHTTSAETWTDKILRFLRGIEASLFSFVP